MKITQGHGLSRVTTEIFQFLKFCNLYWTFWQLITFALYTLEHLLNPKGRITKLINLSVDIRQTSFFVTNITRIQNPVKRLGWSFWQKWLTIESVNYFRKKAHIRCLTGLLIRLWISPFLTLHCLCSYWIPK